MCVAAMLRALARVPPRSLALAQAPRVFGTMPGSKEIVEECARFAAQPEVGGAPVALDFSSQGRSKGYSKRYADAFDRIFSEKRGESSADAHAADDSRSDDSRAEEEVRIVTPSSAPK